MLLRNCIAALSVAVALTGCSQLAVQMAKSNLGMNSAPPSFESYKAPVANDPEAKEIVELLSASEQSFDPVKGKPYEAEKKQQLVDSFKQQKDSYVKNLLPVMSKVDAVKSFKDFMRTHEETDYWYGTVQPAGSKDAVISESETLNTMMHIVSKTYAYTYTIDSAESGRAKMAELDLVIRRAIAPHASDWTVRDKAKQDADSRSMIDSYTQMIDLSSSRPDIVTAEQVEDYQQKIKDAKRNISQPSSYVTYSYNWESKFVNQIGGASMPKLNSLTIMVMNGMSETDMMGRESKSQNPNLTMGITSSINMQ